MGIVFLTIVTALSQVAAVAGDAEPAGATQSDPLRASPVIGGDFRVSDSSTIDDDWRPEAAYNPTNNRYLIVWQDWRNEVARGSDIYGQLLAADGTPIGANFRISGPGATADDADPAVAYNPTNNQYLVVWNDYRNEGTRGRDIYGRRIKAGGAPAGGDFRISGPGATASEFAPAVAHNPTNNQYLVVWQDSRNLATRSDDIYGRRVKAGGAPVGKDFRISGGAATALDLVPSVAHNPANNQYLVTWHDWRNKATRGWDIYGRRVKAGGKKAGADFRISGAAATSDESHPSVVYNPANHQYLVVWQDSRNSASRGADIYGRRIKAGGTPAGGDFRISGAAATTGDLGPKVAYSPSTNRYLVTWSDARNQGTRGRDIYGRRVKAGGKKAGGDFRISGAAATSDEWVPAVVHNSTSDQYLVVWQDERDLVSRGSDVYGRRVSE